MIVNMHAAKTNLSPLIARAEAGEEVIIASSGSPRVRLTPVAEPPVKRTKGDWLGSLKGQIWLSPDAFDPDPAMMSLMQDGTIFPPDDPT